MLPTLAHANVRGTTLSWVRIKTQLRTKARVRVMRARRAKPSPSKIRRLKRTRPLVQKLRMRRRQDIPDSELGVGEGRGVRAKVKGKRGQPVFGPE